MRRFLALIMLLATTSATSAARNALPNPPSGAETPISAELLPLPDECEEQPSLSDDGHRFITLFGNVDWKGNATQVQVVEPSDSCLKVKAIESVREWKFEPVEPDTKDYWRLSFETTLIYPPGETPYFEMRPYNALKRYPPYFPDRCFNNARKAEIVAVTLDVSEKGEIENLEHYYSTYSCLTNSALTSVKKWEYAPRVIAGRAYPRKNVFQVITFQISNGGGQTHSNILSDLTIIAITLDRKLDPRIALEKIALFEKLYGDKLHDYEKATLLRYRGAAKIDALDYKGALEDLRAAVLLEKDKSTLEGMINVINQLETALAIQGEPVSEDDKVDK